MKITKNFNFPPRQFDSSMLKIGQMMELHEQCPGGILLRTFVGFVLLDNPSSTWDNRATLKGRKLNEGESVTLTQ